MATSESVSNTVHTYYEHKLQGVTYLEAVHSTCSYTLLMTFKLISVTSYSCTHILVLYMQQCILSLKYPHPYMWIYQILLCLLCHWIYTYTDQWIIEMFMQIWLLCKYLCKHCCKQCHVWSLLLKVLNPLQERSICSDPLSFPLPSFPLLPSLSVPPSLLHFPPFISFLSASPSFLHH